jgi:uncharacterized protein YdiU (UPF0061 family)
MWNLARLAHALYPLVEEVPPLQAALDGYRKTVAVQYNALWASKMGLQTWQSSDETLCQRLNQIMVESKCDFTLFYRWLATVSKSDTIDKSILFSLFDAPANDDVKSRWDIWLQQYQDRLKQQDTSDEDRLMFMNKVNPKFILRNWVAQLAIDASTNGDEKILNSLLQRLEKPYDDVTGFEEYEKTRPVWARQRAGCSMLSCSS